MNICGAIFDMDGTLIDSMTMWDTLASDYLKSIGVQPKSDTNDIFKTMTYEENAEYFQTEYGILLSVREIIEGIDNYLFSYYSKDAPLKPGAGELLKKLSIKGVKMCLATATPRRFAEPALLRLNILHYFGAIFTCGEVGFSKETPHIYKAAHNFLGTKKHETPVFEDALYAAKTAKAAGFPVIGVYDICQHQNQGELKSVSDHYFTNLTHFDII